MSAFKPANVSDLTGEQALLIISELRDILWPPEDPTADYDSETIEWVAGVEGLRPTGLSLDGEPEELEEEEGEDEGSEEESEDEEARHQETRLRLDVDPDPASGDY